MNGPIGTPMSDVLALAVPRRTHLGAASQARRAMALVTLLVAGVSGVAHLALRELDGRPHLADTAVAAAPAPSLRLDTGTVTAGPGSIVLRSSVDARLRITVLDGAVVLARQVTPAAAGAPIRVPVSVASTREDRMLAVQVDIEGQPTKTLAVHVPAGEALARASQPRGAALR